MNPEPIHSLVLGLTEADREAQPDGVSLRRLVLADALAEADGDRTWEERIVRSPHPIAVTDEGRITGGYPRVEDATPVAYHIGDDTDEVLCAECRNGGNGCPILFPDGEADPRWVRVNERHCTMVLVNGPAVVCCHCGSGVQTRFGDRDIAELSPTGRIVRVLVPEAFPDLEIDDQGYPITVLGFSRRVASAMNRSNRAATAGPSDGGGGAVPAVPPCSAWSRPKAMRARGSFPSPRTFRETIRPPTVTYHVS
jgi:hypothetical protein